MIGFPGTGYLVNIWNRKGNASSGNGIIEYFKQTVAVLGNEFKVLKVICDSGYYLLNFIEYLEGKSYSYIISATMCQLLHKKILEQNKWIKVTDGIDITEFKFKHLYKKWKKERRYIAVRQEVNERAKATGKFITLLFELPEIKNYRYSIMLTNDSVSSQKEIRDRYKPRAKDKKVKEKLSTIRMKHLILTAVIGKYRHMPVLRLGIKYQKKQNYILKTLSYIENLKLTLKCSAV